MKKIVLILLAALAAAVANAQTAAPSTTIRATLLVERQVVRVGPYARYAQKYLGVVAPLADKQSIEVRRATLAAEPADIAPEPAQASDPSFPSLPVDRTDFTARSADEAAQQAAATIFALRKARIELITGTAGENVFGDGLRAALEEIDRLEAEYLALFMGKQAVQTRIVTFDIVPQRGETSRVVARFSPTDGILAADDLTGEPIVLELKQAGVIGAPAPSTAKPSKNAPPTVRTLLPAQVDCRLLLGAEELTSARVAVHQLGVYADIPVL